MSPREAQAHRQRLEAAFAGLSSIPSGNPTALDHGRRDNGESSGKSFRRKPISERKILLLRLQAAQSPQDIEQAGNAFLLHTKGVLPDSLDILLKLLHHPNEKVLRSALGEILALLSQKRIQPNIMLTNRLSELEQQGCEAETLTFVQGLRHQLQKQRPFP